MITGAAQGLGRALAIELACKYRARILVVDVDGETAAATVEAVGRAGGAAQILVADVSQPETAKLALATAVEAWGQVDLLINNAGVGVLGAVGEVPIEQWRRVIDINLWGVIHGCDVFLPYFRGRGTGQILNIASAAAYSSFPEMSPYNVSKAGVVSLSNTLAAETAGTGISISVACPTFFNSAIWDRNYYSAQWQRRFVERLLSLTGADPGKLAAAIVRGVDRRTFMIHPRLDGRLVWHIQRLLPGLFRRAMAALSQSAKKSLAD